MQASDRRNRFAKKKIWNHQGRIYFSPAVERRFYFVATLCMLIAGILYKTGWL